MASNVLRHGFMLLAVFYLVLQTNAKAIITVECTTDADCTIAAANTVCHAAAKKCKCDSGYTVNPTDNTACTEILDMDCTSDASVCNELANSACNTDKKCACNTNYESTDDYLCKLTDGQDCDMDDKCASDYCATVPGEETPSKKCTEAQEDNGSNGNSAQSVVLPAGMITLILLVAVFQQLF